MVNVSDPLLTLTTTSAPTAVTGPMIVMTLLERLALQPFWVILLTRLLASVLLVELPVEAPEVIVTPPTVMLLTTVLLPPVTVMVA